MSSLDDRLRHAADAVRERTDHLTVPTSFDQPERFDGGRPRSTRVVIALAAAAVVVAVIASVAVVLTRHGSHNRGGNLTVEALAATTQKQSARITITQTLPTGPSDRHPDRLVTTGIADYRTGSGRFETATQSGSGPAKPVETQLVVAGHEYLSIGSWLQGVPESLIRTKKWIDVDTQSASLQSAGLNPFDPFGVFESLHISLDDRGATKFGDQTVEHYTATKRVSTPPSSGPVEKATLVFDVYVDRHGRVTHIQVDEEATDVSSTIQIEFSDYGVPVDVTAPPARLVVRASDLPSDSTPTPTSGRKGALVLRQDIDTSAAECNTPGALAHTEPEGSNGPELCTRLGATIVTGDDVTSAVASGRCVAPTLTADALAQLHRYAQANAPVADLFVISHGRFLGEISLDSPIRNGECWISTNRMTEATARELAAELSGK